MAINRFDTIPQSFHQRNDLDRYVSCLFNSANPVSQNFTLETYLKSDHIWVNKNRLRRWRWVNQRDVQRLGWVDEALMAIEKKENQRFTRHYWSQCCWLSSLI